MSSFAKDKEEEEEVEVEQIPEESEEVLPVPEQPGEDFEGAAALKDQANEARARGDHQEAVDLLSKAMEMGGGRLSMLFPSWSKNVN